MTADYRMWCIASDKILGNDSPSKSQESPGSSIQTNYQASGLIDTIRMKFTLQECLLPKKISQLYSSLHIVQIT